MEEKNQTENQSPPPAAARIFVGGLGATVTADDLRRVFELCGGAVDSIDFVRSKGRSFAYVDFSPSSHNSLSNLIAKYNGCVWKGGKLKLEKAKEHYLNRLAREWVEASEAEAEANAHSSSEVRRDLLKESDESIHIFFPRLRKVKKLPLRGTGKHKYSFQRIEVPALPKYFCACEEHSGFAEQGKQVRHVEVETDGVGLEEVNVMNKVMNALFQMQNHHSDAIGDLNCEETEEEEDDLLINVVSKGNNEVGSIERQQVPQLFHDQPKKENLERKSKRERSQDAFAMQKVNDHEPPTKRKKEVAHDQSEGNFHRDSEKLSKPREVQKAKLQSGKGQSNAHVSWSQKFSWKELVNDNSSNAFSLSSTQEVQPISNADDIPASDKQNENLEGDSIASTEKGQLQSDPSDGPESNREKENSVSLEKKTEGLVEAQPAEPNGVSSQIKQGASWMQKFSWTQLLGQDSTFTLSGTPGSDNEKLNAIGNPARFGTSVSETKAEEESKKSVIQENEQIIMGNKASTSELEENCSVAVKQTSPVKVEISETCTFMRSATSLKEWTKTKAALSGSLKRKGNRK